MLPQKMPVHKVSKLPLSMKNPNDPLFLINVLYMDQSLSINILDSYVFDDSDLYFLLINDKQN